MVPGEASGSWLPRAVAPRVSFAHQAAEPAVILSPLFAVVIES